jgi:hypothetical protein
MKTVLFTACLLLAVTGYQRWVNLASDLAESASQQIPQTFAAMMSERFGEKGVRAHQPGQEKQIAANLKETLRALRNDESLSVKRVELKHVRFVPTNAFEQSSLSDRAEKVSNAATGYYVAALNYDLMNPLTMESGAALLAAVCSSGIAQVRLSDGYDVVKTFRCPDLKR